MAEQAGGPGTGAVEGLSARPHLSFAPVPEPDARKCRHRVSGILASMSATSKKRISGTYWERYLLGALLPVFLVYFTFTLKNGIADLTTLSCEPAAVMLCISVVVFIIASEPARRLKPVSLYDRGDALQIHREDIPLSAVKKITSLRRYRPALVSLFEIEYESKGVNRSAVILSKPDWQLLTQHHFEPRSLRLLLEAHPELKSKVQNEREI